MLTTLGNFFRFAQNSEAHRGAAVSWGKFNRLIASELAQKPDDRMDSIDFINICRQDLDRLIEQAPQIPDDIIESFEEKFENEMELERPDICNRLEHTKVFDNSKERMKVIVQEMALNLKHKKRLLREELLPDLELRMKAMIDKTLREYKESLKNKNDEESFAFMDNVSKKLTSLTANNTENILVDVVGSSST